MDQTFPDIMKVVDEDIREVWKEVRSLDYDSLLVVGILVLAALFSIFAAKRKISNDERMKEMMKMNLSSEKKTE